MMQWLAKPLERRSEADQAERAARGAVATDLIGGCGCSWVSALAPQAEQRYEPRSRGALAATMRTHGHNPCTPERIPSWAAVSWR
ncbi:hypothetical protein GS937_16560 [Rhodococcus hoagii]|nr:hypothetical protein [Prescottella equi]